MSAITHADLLSGRIDAAVVSCRGGYLAWTKTWQGQIRPDYPAALADLRDRLALGAKTKKGIYYFPTYTAARQYAETNGHPTDRIIAYDLGWAIQLRVSGPYVGPRA